MIKHKTRWVLVISLILFHSSSPECLAQQDDPLIDVETRLIDIDALEYTYYVSLEGSDSNTGSELQPFKTITKAVDEARAGDKVLVKSGVYKESLIFGDSGSPGNPIVFVAEPRVIVKGRADLPFWQGIMRLWNKEHIIISGFHVQDSTWFGIHINECSYITIDSCITENTEASGIIAWDSDHIQIINNRVRNACAYDGDPPGRGAQECISVANVDTFQVLYNEIYDSTSGYAGGEGIDTKQSCVNGEVAYNYVHDNKRLGIYVDSYDSMLSDITVHNNVVHNCNQGIAVSSEAGGTASNIKIFNNLAFDNEDNGITIGDWDENGPRINIKIIGNTFVNNGGPFGGGITVQRDANARDITIRNNIVSGNSQWQIMGDFPEKNIICDHNLIDGFRGERSSEFKGEYYQEEDPSFTDLSTMIDSDDPFLLKAAQYTLNPNSVAIDNGSLDESPSSDILGNMRLSDGNVDIGSHEYTESVWNPSFWRDYENQIDAWTPLPGPTVIRETGRLLRPSNIVITSLTIHPTSIDLGDTVTATATLENTGEVIGIETVEIFLNGESAYSKTTNVNGGETKTVIFQFTFDEAGTYTVTTEDKTATIEVKEILKKPDPEDRDNNVIIQGYPLATVVLGIMLWIVGSRHRERWAPLHFIY